MLSKNSNKFLYLAYAGFITLILIVLLTACDQKPAGKKELSQKELIERGKFLVFAAGCGDCHTPKVFGPEGPQPDTTKILSGHPAEMTLPKADLTLVEPGKWLLFTQDLTAAIGPWGASFSANLTPDNETGIGTWQPDMFINAMKTGKHLGAGRPLMPPMPWQNVGQLPEEDLRAIFAYLKSLPAVKNKVPDPIPMDVLMSIK